MDKEIFSQYFFGEENEVNRQNQNFQIDKFQFNEIETTNSIDSIELQTREKDFFDTSSERNCNKRKSREGTEMRGEKNVMKPDQHGATSTRRSRTTEMHNLSERKRRDKINEKLKALQELLPQCTKTDKASMLDEAIEYLKSLQIQLQMMWMENGMAPVVFPDIQQYMSMMSMDQTSHNPFAKMTKMPLIYNQPIMPNSNPIQTENFYMPQIARQGINQGGFGARLVQHEPPFGNSFL